MADRRDDERRFRGGRRDPDTERRIDRWAERYRGSDERGYRDYGDFDWGERRTSPSGAFHEELREERERPWRYGDRTRHTSLPYDADRWSAPRGFDELPEHGEHGHYNLAGLYDLDDLSELRERYRERRRQRGHAPHYGHGPGVENMEPPRLGYSTSTTRRGNEDHELGHGGMLGGTYLAGAPLPMGRGPKGYQRSDTRIREDICDRLMMSWMDAERVEVLVRDGEVTLQGMVKSRDEKRAIEALADSVLGVKDVHNTLRVDRGEPVLTEARPEQRGERREQDQEQTPAQQPGDTPLHS